MRARFPFRVAGKLAADPRGSSSPESTDDNGVEGAVPGDKIGDISATGERVDFTDHSGRGDFVGVSRDDDDGTSPSKSARLSAS